MKLASDDEELHDDIQHRHPDRGGLGDVRATERGDESWRAMLRAPPRRYQLCCLSRHLTSPPKCAADIP
jgi:hypothetical protein